MFVRERRGRPAKRTLKVLRCMLRGVWLVTLDWAADCLREGRLLPHHPYEVQVWLTPAGLALFTLGANIMLQCPHEKHVLHAPICLMLTLKTCAAKPMLSASFLSLPGR